MIKWIFISNSSIWLLHRFFYINTSFSFSTLSWEALISETVDTLSSNFVLWETTFILFSCVFYPNQLEYVLLGSNDLHLSTLCARICFTSSRTPFSHPPVVLVFCLFVYYFPYAPEYLAHFKKKYIPIETEFLYAMASSQLFWNKNICFCIDYKYFLYQGIFFSLEHRKKNRGVQCIRLVMKLTKYFSSSS